MAVSTSSGDWSVWLGRGADAHPPFAESDQRKLQGIRGQSRDLVGVLADILASRNLAPADLAGLVVDGGPGSFTSLRIGLATVRALAWAQQLPVAAVSSLDAMAAQALQEGAQPRLACVLPARRGWWYVATYLAQSDAICTDLIALLASRETAQLTTAELPRHLLQRFGQHCWTGVGPVPSPGRYEVGADQWMGTIAPNAAWMAYVAGLRRRWTVAQLAVPEYLAVSEAEAAAAAIVPDLASDAISQFSL